MYICKECNYVFDEPKIYIERHNLVEPPYEEIRVCPKCLSRRFGKRW